jgi:hypothetical protein
VSEPQENHTSASGEAAKKPEAAPQVPSRQAARGGAKYGSAWRGIWLLTWRGQLTWKRLVWRGLGLLVLPALAFITIPQSERAAIYHRLLNDPTSDCQWIVNRMARGGRPPLAPENAAKLQGIFVEEYGRAEDAWRQVPPETVTSDQAEPIAQKCFENIRTRAKPLLNDEQNLHLANTTRWWANQAKGRSSEPPWSRSKRFYSLLLGFYFFLILPLTCVRGSGPLIRDELQSDTLGFLTTRPLWRHELLVLKFLAQVAWQECIFFIETMLIFCVGWQRHLPDLTGLVPLFLGTQVLAVLTWNALGLLLGLMTRRYFAAGLIYGAIVEVCIGNIPTNINSLSIIRHLMSLLMHNGPLEAVEQWSGRSPLFSIGALLLATALFVSASAVLFTFREYHHASEMQK